MSKSRFRNGKKEHRKRVAKRNELINTKRKQMRKFMIEKLDELNKNKEQDNG
jgi:hypothetical protein